MRKSFEREWIHVMTYQIIHSSLPAPFLFYSIIGKGEKEQSGMESLTHERAPAPGTALRSRRGPRSGATTTGACRL